MKIKIGNLNSTWTSLSSAWPFVETHQWYHHKNLDSWFFLPQAEPHAECTNLSLKSISIFCPTLACLSRKGLSVVNITVLFFFNKILIIAFPIKHLKLVLIKLFLIYLECCLKLCCQQQRMDYQEWQLVLCCRHI